MDPVTASALIMVGSGIITGLMGSEAQKEDRKRQMLLEANRQRFESANQSAQNLGNSQQRSFETLMNGYKSSLIG